MKRISFFLTVLIFTSFNLNAQSNVVLLNDKAGFEAAVSNNEKVVVFFAADWCDYCRTFLPKVEQIVKNYEGLKFFRINYDDNVALFEAEGIKAIPATKLYKDGIKVDEMVVIEVEPLQKKLEDF